MEYLSNLNPFAPADKNKQIADAEAASAAASAKVTELKSENSGTISDGVMGGRKRKTRKGGKKSRKTKRRRTGRKSNRS